MRFLLVITVCFALTACSEDAASPPPLAPAPMINSDAVIRIGFETEESFKALYGELLEKELPGLRYEVVPYQNHLLYQEDIAKWVKEHPSLDIIYVPDIKISEFLETNGLMELDPLIKRDDYSLKPFIPAAIDMARQYGNGTLYGIPASYHSTAIAVNLDLFDRYDIKPPRVNMSWEQIWQLAARIKSADSSLMGYEYPYPVISLFYELGRSKGLALFDEKRKAVTINTESWSKIWNTVITGIRNGSIRTDKDGPNDPIRNPDRNHRFEQFMNGQTAMYYTSISDYHKMLKEQPAFHWSVIPLPSIYAGKGITDAFSIDGLFSVARSTDRKDIAWKLVQFLSSEKAAEWLDEDMEHAASTLKSQNTTVDADAFYRQKPKLRPHDDGMLWSMSTLISTELRKLMTNPELNIDDELEELQLKIEAAIPDLTG